MRGDIYLPMLPLLFILPACDLWLRQESFRPPGGAIILGGKTASQRGRFDAWVMKGLCFAATAEIQNAQLSGMPPLMTKWALPPNLLPLNLMVCGQIAARHPLTGCLSQR